LTEGDLTEALKGADRPECLRGSEVLDHFIREESASVANQLIGAGVPAALAVRISRRMARAARASALAVAGAFWREVLPSTSLTRSRKH
jgi:hypothetical protein